MAFPLPVVSLDSVYLHVSDPDTVRLYRDWAFAIGELDPARLRKGVSVDLYLARGGANGYRFSLWSGDVRLYLSDLPEMGAWLQIGPKFLHQHQYDLKPAVLGWLAGVGLVVGSSTRLRINRVDVVMDVFGWPMSAFTVDEWSRGWVGYASKWHVYGDVHGLETVYIGDRASAVYLRLYDKVLEATKTGDLEFWLQAWDGWEGSVTRVEWEVKPSGGGFDEIVDFSTWSEFRLVQLALYLAVWGRLKVPCEMDENRSRWPLHPFWRIVEAAVVEWAAGQSVPLKRVHKKYRDVSKGFVRYVRGAIESGIARFSDDTVSMVNLFDGFERWGVEFSDLLSGSRDKLERVRRLRPAGVVGSLVEGSGSDE